MGLHDYMGGLPAPERAGRKKLIAAAVRAAELGEPPPRELSLAWDCKRWGALPEAGGMYDQPARLMMVMTVLDNVYQAIKQIKSLPGAQIHRLSDGSRAILGWLNSERLWPMQT